MNAYSAFPFRLHWSAQDLAAAVPLRLFELYRFDSDAAAADNASRFARAADPARDWRGGYARPAPMPTRFSVNH